MTRSSPAATSTSVCSDPPLRTASLHAPPHSPFTYTDVGAGLRTIVALHGLPGSVRDFRHLGAALEPQARLIRLDLPGFGGTAATAAGVTLNARADFVVAVLTALDLSGVTLLGHSMGGPVALVAASKARDRVRALALIASAGLSPHRLLRRAALGRPVASAIDVPVLGMALRHVAHRLFRAFGFPASTTLDEVAQTLRILKRFSFDEVRAAVATLTQPTLLAFADDDPFIEPDIALALGHELPDGPRLHFVSGGHNLQKTHARELAEALAAL